MKIELTIGSEFKSSGLRKSELRFTPENKADEAILVEMLDAPLLTDFFRPTDNDPPTIIFDCALPLQGF